MNPTIHAPSSEEGSAPSPTVELDKIPTELRQQSRWVVARTKIPLRAGDPSRRASSTDPTTWAGFDAVRTATGGDPTLRAGFVLGDGFVGVDLDDCRDAATGTIEPWAQAIIDRLNSYTEVSVSGTGIHVICKGTLPPGGRRKGRIEMYDSRQYFITTGNGSDQPVAERTTELDALHADVFGTNGSDATAPSVPHGDDEAVKHLGDDELLAKIRASRQGVRFDRLWHGDTSGYSSHSEADEALCGMLAWWTGKDAARIDRLFRVSGLYREKWERQDYRSATMRVAIAGAEAGYQPSSAAPAARSTPKQSKRFTFHTHRDLLTRPAARFLVKDLLVDGSFVALVAKPGAYKSFLALDLALSVASGQPSWLGYRINRHGPVVYVGSEGVGRLKYRVMAWMAHHGVTADIPNFRWLDDAVALLDPNESAGFVQDVAKLQPALVIFDTLSRSMSGADENSQKEMSRLVTAVDAIRNATGCAVMVVHHLNATGTRERGSTVLTGAVDTTLRVDQPSKGYLTITCRKQKDTAEIAPISLARDARSSTVDVGRIAQSAV